MTPKKNGEAEVNGKGNGVDLIKQPHGGALNSGGTPGHKGGDGGGGRPPDRIRELCRLSFTERVKAAEKIIDSKNEDTKDGDRIRALDLLGKYGGVDKIALTLEEQPERELTPERIAALWEHLEQIKTVKEFEKILVAAATKQIEG